MFAQAVCHARDIIVCSREGSGICPRRSAGAHLRGVDGALHAKRLERPEQREHSEHPRIASMSARHAAHAFMRALSARRRARVVCHRSAALPYPIKPLFFPERIGFRGRTKSCGQGVLVGFLKASVWARLVSRETTRDRTTAAVVKGAGETARPLAGTRRRTPTMQPLLHRQTLRRQRARRPKPSQTQNLCVECSVLCGSH